MPWPDKYKRRAIKVGCGFDWSLLQRQVYALRCHLLAAKPTVMKRIDSAVAGGSLLKILGALAGSSDVDWSKWHVFFGDERNVPHRCPR